MKSPETDHGAGEREAEEAELPPIDYPRVLAERREVVAGQLAPALAATGPLVWEVGSGHGHFLTAYAAANPEHICIGVDIASDRVGRAQKKRDRARLTRLHFIRAEAGLFLDVLPLERRFTRVFVLFPDPWPKARHHKHRLLQEKFLTRLAERMEPAGRLYFRTDYAPYFAEAADAVRQHPRWALVDEPWPFDHATVFQERAESHQSLVAGLHK